LKITGKTKYEDGSMFLPKVRRKKGTLVPIRMTYKETNNFSTTRGEKKDNSGYARRIKPRLGIARNW
jgi:hypothetical protein